MDGYAAGNGAYSSVVDNYSVSKLATIITPIDASIVITTNAFNAPARCAIKGKSSRDKTSLRLVFLSKTSWYEKEDRNMPGHQNKITKLKVVSVTPSFHACAEIAAYTNDRDRTFESSAFAAFGREDPRSALLRHRLQFVTL